ncbi:glycoside hydrolase family 43 protein [Mangrovibacterium lignilyticum]|uniref:glycoside hydrolase family 43 protein n=1 Tax=Mangrovibacterium lignilyticum TaxID=2668052 RepID=UPI0013D0ADE8|nr:glycoside hydrolase family 43 protein [Mangrovibacterium lignilyticum]
MKQIIVILLVIICYPIKGQDVPISFSELSARNPFTPLENNDGAVSYQNPVIPGFYSDPSVCRVGADYYLITSTFEYFPAVPVFHSKDLINWEQIGHCIHRKDQLPEGFNLFAATLRHHDGVFYMITTNLFGKGNFYVTATNPSGPWSDPIWVNAKGIDPDLFFDEDGKSYIITSTFELFQIDLDTGKLLSEGRKVWHGTGGRYPEGPHIYLKDGFYYLMAAEGGTEEAHCETIARSNSIWGPYANNPANPILTHCNAAGQGKPIQGVGHADMVKAEDGSWWVVFHGYRSIANNPQHTLGRETCLAPVSWPQNGWPVVNGNGTVNEEMNCPTLPLVPVNIESGRLNFGEEQLGLEWNYIGVPDSHQYSLTERKGYLRLRGSASKIAEPDSPTFAGRRLQHLYFTATTSLEFEPDKDGEEAGMILLNNGSYFDMMIGREAGQKYLSVKLMFGTTLSESARIPLSSGPVTLRITGEKSSFSFSYAQDEDNFQEVEKVDAKFLSSETAGGFTGVYVGLYATGNGEACSSDADFDWFEYLPKDNKH